jgi:hypothetical protein
VPFAIRGSGGEAGLFVIERDKFECIVGGGWLVSDKAADEAEDLFGAVAELGTGIDIGTGYRDDSVCLRQTWISSIDNINQGAAGGVAGAGCDSGGGQLLLLSQSGMQLASFVDDDEPGVVQVGVDAGGCGWAGEWPELPAGAIFAPAFNGCELPDKLLQEFRK